MRRLIAIGADGILTDAPDVLVDVLEKMGQRKPATAVVNQ